MEWLSENWLLVLFKNETSETKMEQPAKLPPPE